MSGDTGKYRLDARLGGGGMAEVFVGSTIGAEGFSRRVAIKRVLPGFSDNEAFAKMFVAEAQISSRLVHPNIVSVLDFDRDPEQRLFLVMEMVEGKDLDTLLTSGPLPVPVIIFIISEVLRGLGYAHDLPVGADMRGVIHRDVSPHNVLLSWEGSIKVSDFGIAKARAASEATASVFIKGKPAYMSPEQANGMPLDGRSDLFALGIMLWEMLAGHRLFVGTDTRSTLAAVLFGQIPRPRTQRPEVPADVERVCMKLLERDLAARYATAEDAIADLLDCQAAPRNGRAQLMAILAERYPHDAPVRQSLQRAREAGTSQPPQAYTPPPQVPSQLQSMPMPMHEGGPQVGAALPSLGAAMGAQTGSLAPGAGWGPPQTQYPHGPAVTEAVAPARGGGGKKLALVLVITALSGLATFAVVTQVRPGRGAGPEPTTPVATPVTTPVTTPVLDAAVAVARPVDAATVPAAPDAAVVAAVPVDAAAGADAKKEETPKQPVHGAGSPPDGQGLTGTLAVHHFPVVTVEIDGHPIQDTPLINYRLPVGRHTVHITNVDNHIDLTKTVTIVARKLTTEDFQ